MGDGVVGGGGEQEMGGEVGGEGVNQCLKSTWALDI